MRLAGDLRRHGGNTVDPGWLPRRHDGTIRNAALFGGGRAARQHADYDAGEEGQKMRGILLWAVGIPIPVIILLYLFHVI